MADARSLLITVRRRGPVFEAVAFVAILAGLYLWCTAPLLNPGWYPMLGSVACVGGFVVFLVGRFFDRDCVCRVRSVATAPRSSWRPWPPRRR